MNDQWTPYARIDCYLSQAGIRDAVRKGVLTGELAVHYLEPGSPHWERFFSFQPELVYADDDFGGPTVAVGTVLTIGRPVEVVIDDADRDVIEIAPFDFVETWRQPHKELKLGETPIKVFDAYLSVSELLDDETRSRSDALELGERALSEAIGQWRRWIGEHGIRYIDNAITAGENVNPKLVNGIQIETLRVALDSLKSTLTEFYKSPDNDLSRSLLMDRFASTAPTIGEIAMAAVQSEIRLNELEEARRWIGENGSSRLRKAVELNLLQKSMGAYRDERLHVERPGWEWIDRSDQMKDVLNPSEEDLDALALAKECDQWSQLRFNPSDRSTWIVGHFLRRRIGARASALTQSKTGYAFDEEPF
jgi:hypothetical protein